MALMASCVKIPCKGTHIISLPMCGCAFGAYNAGYLEFGQSAIDGHLHFVKDTLGVLPDANKWSHASSCAVSSPSLTMYHPPANAHHGHICCVMNLNQSTPTRLKKRNVRSLCTTLLLLRSVQVEY